MKMKLLRFTVCIILIFMIIFQLNITKNNVFSAETKKLLIQTDSRIELITILQIMIGVYPMTYLDFAYLREVQDTFYQYWDHPILPFFGKLWYVNGFNNELPCTFMLHLSDPPELKVRIPINKQISDIMGGDRNVNIFIELLKDFVKKTGFIDFYEDHKPLYKKLVEDVENGLSKREIISSIENYFGLSQNSYCLILAPLVSQRGYGTNVQNIYYSILGPSRVENDLPYYSSPDELIKLLFYDFSIAYINPLINKNKKEIDTMGKLLKPIKEPMMYQNIMQWNDCMKEHLVRAVTQRLVEKDFGYDSWKLLRSDSIQNYFYYIDYFEKWLINYENNKFIYPAFSDYYPIINSQLKELCELPYIPTFCEIENTSNISVQIIWKDNSYDELSYNIYRRYNQKENFLKIAELDPDSFYYKDYDVKTGESYQYLISAVNQNGEIESIILDTEIPESTPYIPRNFHVQKKDDNYIFEWDFKFKCDGFIIYEIIDYKREEIVRVKGDDRSNLIDTISKGKHYYTIHSYINYNESIIESFDSNITSIIVK